jgi:hypothetical protein
MGGIAGSASGGLIIGLDALGETNKPRPWALTLR